MAGLVPASTTSSRDFLKDVDARRDVDARHKAGHGKVSAGVEEALAQHPRMHPPLGVIELKFPRRGFCVGIVLEDRKTGRA
jgi:hypothetical protein